MGRRQMVPTPEAAGLMFAVGKNVEVSFDRESLRDCWLPATILKNSDDDTFLVEYQQPGTGDEAILHKVTVDCLHIRPSPPHLRDKNFALLEKVDIYYDFGWWSGVITKELADNRYNVFFKHTKKEREFIYSRIRPHMEWKGGKWFNTSQGYTNGRTPHSFIDEPIEQTTPSNDEQSSAATSIMKKTRQENLDGNDTCSPPSKKRQDEIMNDDSSKKTNCPSVGQSEGYDSEVSGMTNKAFGKTENLSHGKKVCSKLGKGIEVKTLTIDSSKKKGRLRNELRSLQASNIGSKVDSIKTRTRGRVGRKHITKDPSLPVDMGSKRNGMTISQGNLLQEWSTESVTREDASQQPSIACSLLTVAEKEGSKGDAASLAPKRKRGRPPKLLALSPKTPVTFHNQKGGVIPSALSVVEGGQKKEVVLTTGLATNSLEQNQGPVKEQPGMQNAPLSNGKLPNEITRQDLDVQLGQETKKYFAKKGKLRTIRINNEPPAQDTQNASEEKTNGSLEKDSAARNPEASVDKSLHTVSDDRPRGFEAKDSPITVHGPEEVPFVRSTSLWKTIESMEIFRMLPQKPHFRPLLKGVKEGTREGLAIGTMVTFSTVVDKTRGLRFDDPISTIEDCLETLVELENNGFDVKVIRERLTRLLMLKDKQKVLAERSKVVVEKIEEHKVLEKRDDEEIEAINRQMRELEEKRKGVLLKEEKRNAEIGIVEAMNEEIEEEMRGVGAEFDGLAAAPL